MKKGFSTLLIVIILGSVSLGLILMLTTSSFWAVKSGIDDKSSARSKSLINACGEIALETIRENNSFTGSSSVLIDGNTCSYTVVDNGGSSRGVSASGNFSGMYRKIQINTTAFNPLVISSWQEIQ